MKGALKTATISKICKTEFVIFMQQILIFFVRKENFGYLKGIFLFYEAKLKIS